MSKQKYTPEGELNCVACIHDPKPNDQKPCKECKRDTADHDYGYMFMKANFWSRLILWWGKIAHHSVK